MKKTSALQASLGEGSVGSFPKTQNDPKNPLPNKNRKKMVSLTQQSKAPILKCTPEKLYNYLNP